MRKDIVIFDLDGTLTDSRPAIFASYRRTAEAMGFPIPDDEHLGPRLCGGLDTNLRTLFGVTGDRLAETMAIYRRTYTGLMEEVRTFPGTEEMLDGLSMEGAEIDIATMKIQEVALDFIGRLGLLKRFSIVRGAETDGSVTKTEMILDIVGDRDPRKAVMIGDCVQDLEAARGAGIDFVAASYGYGLPPEKCENMGVPHIDDVRRTAEFLGNPGPYARLRILKKEEAIPELNQVPDTPERRERAPQEESIMADRKITPEEKKAAKEQAKRDKEAAKARKQEERDACKARAVREKEERAATKTAEKERAAAEKASKKNAEPSRSGKADAKGRKEAADIAKKEEREACNAQSEKEKKEDASAKAALKEKKAAEKASRKGAKQSRSEKAHNKAHHKEHIKATKAADKERDIEQKEAVKATKLEEREERRAQRAENKEEFLRQKEEYASAKATLKEKKKADRVASKQRKKEMKEERASAKADAKAAEKERKEGAKALAKANKEGAAASKKYRREELASFKKNAAEWKNGKCVLLTEGLEYVPGTEGETSRSRALKAKKARKQARKAKKKE